MKKSVLKRFLGLFIILVSLFALATVLTGCDVSATSGGTAVPQVQKSNSENSMMAQYMDMDLNESSAGLEMAQTEMNQRKLDSTTKTPTIDKSLSRENLAKRIKWLNDPNKISYIYLINYGKVMAFYPIKGKAESVNSLLTTSFQAIDDPNGYGEGHQSLLLESPDIDGTYGQNGPEGTIFFFTADTNAYVEWHGDYMVCDQPLQLSTQPELVRNVK